MNALPLGHTVIHCHDHWDSTNARWAAGLTSHTPKALALDIPAPGRSQASDLATGLAMALGHPGSHQPGGRHHTGIAPLLPGLLGYRAADLVLHRAHWLPAATLQTLLEHAAASDTRVWLLTTPPVNDSNNAHTIAAWVHPDDTLSWRQTRALWDSRDVPAPPKPAKSTPRRTPFPAVPDSHFTSFRTRAATKLTAAQMRRVDTQLDAAIEAGVQLSYDLNATRHEHEAQGRSDALAAHLVNHLLDHHDADPAVATVRLRGLQIGLLHHRWHLDADLDAYLAGHARTQPPTEAETDADLDQLLATVNPDELSAAVLTLCGIPASHTWRVRIDDVSADGMELAWHGDLRPVRPAAARLLAAARESRRRKGAGGEDPLHPWPSMPPFSRQIMQATDATLLRHGVLSAWRRCYDVPTEGAVCDELGLRLQHLPAVPLEIRAGRAPRSAPKRDPEQWSDRITADPRHARRLTDLEATVVCAVLRSPGAPLPTTGGVQRALANLRWVGVVGPGAVLTASATRALTRGPVGDRPT